MPIMAKSNDEYAEVKAIKTPDGTEIDYVLSKVDNTYKRTYTATRELEDTPPLEFKSIKPNANLIDYRIYGQTVDGESVGDRTGNLFDKSGSQYGNNLHWVPTRGLVYSDAYYGSPIMDVTGLNTITRSYTGTSANYFLTSDLSQFVNVSNVGTVDAGVTVNVPDGYTKYVFNIPNTIRPDSIMVNSGSTALPYEPYGYKVPVTVEGKNLLQNTVTSQTVNGVTFTVNNDGSITCNGTATTSAPSILYIPFTLPIKLYELSGCPDSGSTSTYRVDIRNIDYSMYKYNGNDVVDDGTGCLFDGGNNQYCIRIAPGYTCDNLTFYPMIRKADIEDDTYEPYRTPVTTPIYLPEQIRKVGDEAEYIDYGTQKQHRVRKNLLPNTATSQTKNGVTFTVNSDGSVTCNTDENGATADTRCYLVGNNGRDFKKLNINANAIITGCPLGGNTKTYSLFILRKNDDTEPTYNTWAEIGNGWTLPYSETNKYVIYINISTGTICDNLTFYPMIRLATIKDDTYEPYIENTDIDVTLPALPTVTGTNVLSVGTEVQPSDMYIKGNFKMIAGGGE